MVGLKKILITGSDDPIVVMHEFGSIKAAQDYVRTESKIIRHSMERQNHTVECISDRNRTELIISDAGRQIWELTIR